MSLTVWLTLLAGWRLCSRCRPEGGDAWGMAGLHRDGGAVFSSDKSSRGG